MSEGCFATIQGESKPATRLLSFRPEVLTRVLGAVTNHERSRTLGHTAAVSVDRVMAWAWKPARLHRCAERLAAGERAPAVHLSRYWLHGEAWYTVSDGHHRTIAARQAGLRRIRAKIGGESWCEPERCWLDTTSGRLWRAVQPGGQVLSLVMDGIEAELAEALLAVGVNRLR